MNTNLFDFCQKNSKESELFSNEKERKEIRDKLFSTKDLHMLYDDVKIKHK